MKINPVGNRVLVKVIETENKTANGLFIPESAKDKIFKGMIVEVGSGDNKTVSVNDIVIYDKYAGTSIKIDSIEHLIVENKDIIAIIEEQE